MEDSLLGTGVLWFVFGEERLVRGLSTLGWDGVEMVCSEQGTGDAIFLHKTILRGARPKQV